MALNIAAINSNTPPISGIFHFKIRDDIIPGIRSLVNASGRCEDPEISLSYDQDGNLTWVVRNATRANLNSWLECEPCRNYGYIFDQVDSIDINLINNEASGYQGLNIYGCPYSISAHNYCCGSSSGCTIPYICLSLSLVYENETVIIDPDIYNCGSPSGYLLCAGAGFGENNGIGQVILNGVSLDPGVNCEDIGFGNSVERFYNLTAINICGIVSFQSLETHCCHRKESAIVEIDGFESFNESCVNNYTSHCPSADGFSIDDLSGTRQESFSCNFEDINGTYIIPICYQDYYSTESSIIEDCRGCESFCASKYINTGIRITLNYSSSDSTTLNRFSYTTGITTTSSGSESLQFIASADLVVGAYGFTFRNFAVQYIRNGVSVSTSFDDGWANPGDLDPGSPIYHPFLGLSLFGNNCENSNGSNDTVYRLQQLFRLIRVQEYAGQIYLHNDGYVQANSPVSANCYSYISGTVHTNSSTCSLLSSIIWLNRNYYSNVTWI